VKLASQLSIGDEIPLIGKLPVVYKNVRLNIIEIISNFDIINKIRIKPKNKRWEDFKKFKNYISKKFLGRKVSNYSHWNYLPLNEYLKIRNYFTEYYSEEELVLVTGRGPSYSEFPAVINIDKNFARFIGYYLSEGCITEDKKPKRIRITIHPEEKELLKDIKSILDKWEISYSLYRDKNYKFPLHLQIIFIIR